MNHPRVLALFLLLPLAGTAAWFSPPLDPTLPLVMPLDWIAIGVCSLLLGTVAILIHRKELVHVDYRS
jgi:uncharacterized membrane protein